MFQGYVGVRLEEYVVGYEEGLQVALLGSSHFSLVSKLEVPSPNVRLMDTGKPPPPK